MTANAGTVTVDCPCGNQIAVPIHLGSGETRDGVHHIPLSVDIEAVWPAHADRFHTAA